MITLSLWNSDVTHLVQRKHSQKRLKQLSILLRKIVNVLNNFLKWCKKLFSCLCDSGLGYLLFAIIFMFILYSLIQNLNAGRDKKTKNCNMFSTRIMPKNYRRKRVLKCLLKNYTRISCVNSLIKKKQWKKILRSVFIPSLYTITYIKNNVLNFTWINSVYCTFEITMI